MATEAEEALIQAAINNWVTGRFNHLIDAVVKERENKAIHLVCLHCGCSYGSHSYTNLKCPRPDGGWSESSFEAKR